MLSYLLRKIKTLAFFASIFTFLINPAVALAATSTTVTTTSVADLTLDNVIRSQSKVPLMTFTVKSTRTPDEQLKSVKVQYSGTNKADVSKVYLYRESGGSGGTFDSATDIEMASDTTPSAGGEFNLDPADYAMTANTDYQFYIAADVASGATFGNNIDVKVVKDKISFKSGNWPNTTDEPQFNPAGSSLIIAGTLIVKKQMVGGTDTFGFTGAPSGSISSDNGTITEVKTAIGQYTSTETLVAGWDVTSVSCDDANSTGSVANRNAVFNLESGETITCTFVNTKTPTLTVNKVVDPTSDTGKFNLQIDRVDKATDVSNGGTTGAQLVSIGSHTVGEVAGTDTDLSNYATVINGNCGSDGSITLAAGEDKTCTITNSRKPRLTITKVVTNDNGGTKAEGDFPLFVDGNPVNSGEQITLTVGTRVVSETGDSAYEATFSGDCDANGSVTLNAGDVKSCTITNNDIAPKLTLVKKVTKDNGGTASASDWKLTATGPTTISGAGGVVSDSTFILGDYTLSEEDGPSGYTASDWSCSGGGSQNGNQLSIGLAENVTCEITNNDQPGTLVVKKVVKNDNGGTLKAQDFSFKVNGGDTTAFEEDGENDLTVDAGAYTVTEPSVNGYTTNYDNCTDVIVPNGGIATCTITNDDIQPQLTVIKTVTKNYGGLAVPSDFTMVVIATNPSNQSFAGDVAGTTITLDAGTYGVSEFSLISGYSGSFSTDCLGNINIGEQKTCTITNYDQPAEIHGMKFNDKNGNGVKNNGDNVLEGWTIYLDTNNNGVLDGEEPSKVTDANGNYAFTGLNANTTYKVREVGQDGWKQTTANPADVFLANGQVLNNINFGNFKFGEISGMKFNDINGNHVKDLGEPGLAGWTIKITGPNGFTASFITNNEGKFDFTNLGPGRYNLKEVGQTGWRQIVAPRAINIQSGTISENNNFGNQQKKR